MAAASAVRRSAVFAALRRAKQVIEKPRVVLHCSYRVAEF
jgi:hypothetical protein